ncbi:hypothetical protein JW859_10275 [bacterium]|nr:hypothetical protein [bacterium]
MSPLDLFQVYCRTGATKGTYWTSYGQTSGEYYEYYLKSVGSAADSDPSNTAGAYPCEAEP